MDSSTKDKIAGHAKEAKGAVKETIGRATNDPDTEASGTGDKVEGKVQDKVGDIKKVFGK
ncbi:MAG: CsbD family protein [Chthoniobacterales bacterium]